MRVALSSQAQLGQHIGIKKQSQYYGHRFLPEIISHTVWLYHRFALSFHDIEDLLSERGISVTYETVRQWCLKFSLDYANKLRKRQSRLGDTWFINEVLIKLNGKRQYLWRAVDQDGDVVDILVQSQRNKKAACRFFRKMLKSQGTPRKIVQKVHTNIPANPNGKLDDLNCPDKSNSSSQSTAKFIIYFVVAANHRKSPLPNVW